MATTVQFQKSSGFFFEDATLVCMYFTWLCLSDSPMLTKNLLRMLFFVVQARVRSFLHFFLLGAFEAQWHNIYIKQQ